MKVKLALPGAAIMLFMVAGTGYAHPTHNDHHAVSENNAWENPNPIRLRDTTRRGVEVTVESPTENRGNASPTTSTSAPLVSAWLEARATEEAITREAMTGKSTETAELTVEDEGMEALGGGWCNSCGCWMRHGCDSNGNCGNSHFVVCSGSGCVLHPGACINT